MKKILLETREIVYTRGLTFGNIPECNILYRQCIKYLSFGGLFDLLPNVLTRRINKHVYRNIILRRNFRFEVIFTNAII